MKTDFLRNQYVVLRTCRTGNNHLDCVLRQATWDLTSYSNIFGALNTT